MAKSNRVSIMPSKAEKGGDIGFPVGAIVTIIDAKWTEWQEAGEKAYGGQTGRKAEDPALMLTGEVEGQDEPKVVMLGAGKATRLVPSKDGEFLEAAENSSAGANSDSSKSNIFLASLVDKKQHGKMTFPEKQLDELGISEALIGLKFVAGSKMIEYNFKDKEGEEGKGGAKSSAAMIADEIKELPKSVGGTGTGKASSKKKVSAKDDDDEEEERPAKKSKKPADDDDDEDEAPVAKKKSKKSSGDADEAAEKAVIDVLENNPKYRKGLPEGAAYIAVHKTVKDEDNAEDIMKLIETDEWMQHKDRPWTYDEDGGLYTQVE